MRVAVTGIAGYLGGVLARRLADEPTVNSILGFDLVPPRTVLPKVEFQRVDVRGADFARLLSGADALFHLAFIVEPPRHLSITEIDAINIEGSRRAFEGAIAAGVPRIVYSSSIAAYGAHPDNPEILTEDSPLRPNEGHYYSRAKGRVEAILDDLQASHPGMIVVRFRPPIFLGPTINNPIGRGLSAGVLFNVGPNVRADFLWDQDVADAFVLALTHDRSDVFNLSNGAPLTMDQVGELVGRRVVRVNLRLIRAVARAAGAVGLISKPTLEWLQALQGSICVSSDRAREHLGWHPRFDSAGAILEFAKYRSPRGSASQ